MSGLVQMFPPKVKKNSSGGCIIYHYYSNHASTGSETWQENKEKSDYPPAAFKSRLYSNLVIAVHVKAFSYFLQ